MRVYFDFFFCFSILGQGQNLARETKCLHSLCDIFRLDPLLYNYMLYYSFGFRKDPFCQNITVLWLSSIFLLMAVTQILNCIPNFWKCHKHVVFVIRSCLPGQKFPSSSHKSEKWFNDIDEDWAKLWNSVVVALHSLLQNPQNGEKISYLILYQWKSEYILWFLLQ